MSVVMGILFCMLASIGLVQAAGWIMQALGAPKARGMAYQVVPLCNNPEELEAQLRYQLFLLRWDASPQPRQIILLDTGLPEEGRAICCSLLRDTMGVAVCTPGELEDFLAEAAGCA